MVNQVPNISVPKASSNASPSQAQNGLCAGSWFVDLLAILIEETDVQAGMPPSGPASEQKKTKSEDQDAPGNLQDPVAMALPAGGFCSLEELVNAMSAAEKPADGSVPKASIDLSQLEIKAIKIETTLASQVSRPASLSGSHSQAPPPSEALPKQEGVAGELGADQDLASLAEAQRPKCETSSLVPTDSGAMPALLDHGRVVNAEETRRDFAKLSESIGPLQIESITKGRIAAAIRTTPEAGAEQDKQSDKQAPKTDASHISVLAGTPSSFKSELTQEEAPRAVAHLRDRLPEVLVPIARRVSIDIGEGDSRVMVTIHERAGDVSLKFHSATEPVRAGLQASVGSLLESLQRQQIPLANMDFTSGFHNGSPSQDPGPRRERRSAPQPNSKFRLEADAPISDVEVIAAGTTINLRG